jgi:hypothetical protein
MLKTILIVLIFVTHLSALNLYLVGKDGERKGCITCNEYSGDSVWNDYSTYGNEYNGQSIWNDYGPYGNNYSSDSPWNAYGKGMKIVDLNGNFYGYFTINAYSNQTKVPLLKL